MITITKIPETCTLNVVLFTFCCLHIHTYLGNRQYRRISLAMMHNNTVCTVSLYLHTWYYSPMYLSPILAVTFLRKTLSEIFEAYPPLILLTLVTPVTEQCTSVRWNFLCAWRQLWQRGYTLKACLLSRLWKRQTRKRLWRPKQLRSL